MDEARLKVRQDAENGVAIETNAAEDVASLMESPSRFMNRELSWLEFNRRVLEEALERAITRCWSNCASSRSRPAISTSSSWSASRA